MRLVPVQLGSPLPEGTLYRKLVQPEFDGQVVELLPGRAAEVNPRNGVRRRKLLGHVAERGPLVGKRAVTIRPGEYVSHDPAPCRDLVGILVRLPQHRVM